MKMAKASSADMERALKLCSALEAVDRRFFPTGSEGENDPEDFDLEDDAHCGQVLRHLHQVLQGGSIGRVIWGMYVMLDPANKVVDPDADTLEPHPDAVASEADAKRYRWLRATARSTAEHWSGRWSLVIDGPAPMRNGCADALDEAVDAAMAPRPRDAGLTQ